MKNIFTNMTDDAIYIAYAKEDSDLLKVCISKGDAEAYQQQAVLLLDKYKGTIVEKLVKPEWKDKMLIAEYMIKQSVIGEQYDGAVWEEKMAELAEQYRGTIVESYLQEAEDDLEDILQMEDANDFIISYMDYLNDKCGYGEKVEVLTDRERIVYYVDTMNSEVHSKGFKEYLQSDDFPGFEVLEHALQTIGANAVYDILQDVKRKPKRSTFDKLDDRFYEYPDDLEQLIMDYIKIVDVQ